MSEATAKPALREEHHEELPKANVDDSQALKQILDEAVCKTILESDYRENTKYNNIKLLIMILAIGVSAFAQFYPKPFAEKKNILGLCAVTFVGLNIALAAWMTFVERDYIMFLYPKLTMYPSVVQTELPRYESEYTIKMMLYKAPTEWSVERKWSVGKWFDREGRFDEVGFTEEVKKVVQEYERKKIE